MSEISIFIYKVDYSLDKNYYADGLSEDILKHCYSYKIEKDYKNSCFAYFKLRLKIKELYNIDLNEIPLLFNEHGKPVCSNIHFSISHSLGYVGFAISKKEVGFDIEFLENIKDKESILNILNASDKVDALIKWSMKEAYAKFLGTGLNSSIFKNDLSVFCYYKLIDLDNNKGIISFTDGSKIDEKSYKIFYNDKIVN